MIQHDAKEILENPAFQKALEEYSKQLVKVWAASHKLEDREAAWNQQQALTAVVNHITGFIEKADYEVKINEQRKFWTTQ